MDTSSNSSIEKCTCDKSEPSQDDTSDSSNPDCSSSPKDKKLKISLTSLGLNFRRGRSKRNKKSNQTSSATAMAAANDNCKDTTKKSPNKWGIKFNCTKKEPKTILSQDNSNCCKCTCYRRTDEVEAGAAAAAGPSSEQSVATTTSGDEASGENKVEVVSDVQSEISNNEVEFSNDCRDVVEVQQVENPVAEGERIRGIYGIHSNSSCIILNGSWDMHWIRTIHEDCDEAARLTRAREIEQGVEAPANFKPVRRIQLLCSNIDGDEGSRKVVVYPSDVNVDSLRSLFHDNVTLQVSGVDSVAGCHTQVDFIHCLVPDMYEITQCSFYWGKMDRYEAERLLDGKPEGTFLLRDSAQEEFLFSVSFRKYARSLHARVEQWNHKFSFDAHDPGVFTSDTVCGLMEHYKDPSSCMFFEPMLSFPLNRNFPFSLQHLCRSVIVSRLTYDNIKELQLPKTLKSYLKEYHYKQKVRVERFDDDIQYYDVRDSKGTTKDCNMSANKG